MKSSRMIGESVAFAAAAASMPGLPAAVKAAADAADDVDRKSRFPSEAINLLKDARLLSCSLPTDLGGRSYGIAELAVIARALGGACSSAGMVFAMKHAQALSLGHHAHEGRIANLTSRIAPTSHCSRQLPPRSQMEATSARRPAP
jgi:acyl-CoA dehydrogenase